MVDILQTQYCSVFSDPNSILIEQTVVGINQGDPRSIQDIDFDKEDIIKPLTSWMHMQQHQMMKFQLKSSQIVSIP